MMNDIYINVFKELSSAVIILDNDYKILTVNPSAFHLIHCQGSPAGEECDAPPQSLEECTGKPVHLLFPWLREHLETITAVTDTGEPSGMQAGGNIHYNSRCYRVKYSQYLESADGSPSHILLLKDITRQVQRKKELEDTNRLWKAVMAAAFHSIFVLEPDGNILDGNATFAQRLGKKVPQLVGKNVYGYIPPDVAEQRRKRLDMVVQSGHPDRFEDSRQGLHLDQLIYPVIDDGGKVGKLVVFASDITERKRIEQTLLEYQMAIEGSPDMIAVVDENYRYRLANRAFLEPRNMTRQDVIGKTVAEVVGEEAFDKTIKPYLDLGFKGESVQFEMSYTYPESGLNHLLVQYYPVSIENKGITRVVAVIRNITGRKKVELALKESEEKFRLIAETIEDVFWMSTSGIEEMLYVSPAYEDIWGRSRESLYESPQSFLEAIHPDDKERIMAGVKPHSEGYWDYEYRIVRPDGTHRWVKDRGFPVKDKLGDITRMIGTATDVTERVEFEQELMRARQAAETANKELQRLSITDGLTGISNRRYFDDILRKEWRRALRNRTPLALVMGDIDFFKDYNDNYGHLQGDHCLKAVARAIEKAIKRASDLPARYGGEEFAILLPNTQKKGAQQIARDIQKRIKKLNIPHNFSDAAPYVTISFGIASMVPLKRTKADLLIEAADKALYTAKDQGRNRIHTAD